MFDRESSICYTYYEIRRSQANLKRCPLLRPTETLFYIDDNTTKHPSRMWNVFVPIALATRLRVSNLVHT